MRKICPFAVAAALILAGVGGWLGSATYARVHAPVGGPDRSVTTHDECKGSACGGVCRPYLRLELNGSGSTNARSCRPRPRLGQSPVRPLPARAALHARARPQMARQAWADATAWSRCPGSAGAGVGREAINQT